MGNIRIETMYGLATIQDLGRHGNRSVGLPLSGAMDRTSMRIANLLVGNKEETEVIEIALHGGSFTFEGDTYISLCGGDFGYKLNGVKIKSYETIKIKSGDRLEGGPSIRGLYAYMAVRGGFDLSPVLGSKSTFMKSAMGGFKGRKLQVGDLIPIFDDASHRPNRQHMIYEEESFKIQGLTNTIGIILSKDFKEESKSWESYLNKPYKILPTSDRMGLRLEGHPIHIEGGYDILSSPVSYGSIQVPASGQPMILTSDCQTTGGYKVMGKVCEADMMKVVQCGFGASVYFEAIDVVEAQRRLKDLRIKLKSGLKIIEMRERHFNIKVGDQSYLVHVREM